MLNPGDYSLCDLAITTALSGAAQTPIQNLEGMLAATVQAKLSYGSGGTTAKVYIQTSMDDGLTWIDIACIVFGMATETVLLNFSKLTPKLTQVSPNDGALADDTAFDGILGTAMRAKVTTTGTYSNSVISVRVSVA